MKRSFIYLLVLTLFVLLMLFSPGERQADQLTRDTLLLPEIAANINHVTRVEIVSAGNHTVATMDKTDSGWRLEQWGGYQADWSRLQTLLSALAQAKIIENKTDKPEYYARLGVEDIATEDAGSMLVNLSIGDQVTGILIGHQAQGRPGQYVRLQNSAASALIDRRLEVSTGQLDWVDSTIVDINASEVAEVEVIHPQGERVFVTRISADQIDFDFVGLPQDREIKNSWAVNSLGTVFSMLKMVKVRPEGGVDWGSAVRMRLLTFSGVEIMADILAAGDEYLLRLSASHPAADVVRQVTENNEDPAQQEIDRQAAIDVTTTVEAINQQVTGWVYGITKQKYDAMVKKPHDLLKPLEAS